MPMMTLNLALLFVFQLAALQFFFWHRENLLHCVSEFLGRLLFGRCRHGSTIRSSPRFRNLALLPIDDIHLAQTSTLVLNMERLSRGNPTANALILAKNGVAWAS